MQISEFDSVSSQGRCLELILRPQHFFAKLDVLQCSSSRNIHRGNVSYLNISSEPLYFTLLQSKSWLGKSKSWLESKSWLGKSKRDMHTPKKQTHRKTKQKCKVSKKTWEQILCCVLLQLLQNMPF